MAAQSLGLEAVISLFPDTLHSNLIAKVNFRTTDQKSDLLYILSKRCTNRKPYKQIPLNSEHEKQLLALPLEKNVTKVSWLNDKEAILSLANTINYNEIIFLENYEVHKGLFAFIRWNKAAEESFGSGLYIKTLELSPPQEFFMKLFRSWPIMNFFNKFNFSALVARDTAKLYSTSSAFGIIVAKDKTAESFIATGRMLQRIWLKAAELEVSLQPTAALLYLYQRIEEEGNRIFSSEQEEGIKSKQTKIKQLFNLSETEIPTMLFRIGYADAPSARSYKHPVTMKDTTKLYEQ